MVFLRLTASAFLISALVPLSVARPAQPKWKLTWSDEFNGPDGSSPDPTKWSFDLGPGSSGPAHESENYTRRPQNVRVEGGNLVIEARRENYIGSNGFMSDYTSGRVKTLNLFSQQYGRFEARIKVASGQGAWSAFWMEGANKPLVGWPRCGEIDILEAYGYKPGVANGTLHGPGFLDDSKLHYQYQTAEGKNLADDFHIYSADWSPQGVVFSVDGIPYGQTVRDTPEHGRDLPLDQPFFMVLNLAISADGPNKVLPSTQFPMQMLVDYVHVYKAQK